eukprot:349741-Chlamydomonas_euryale.AAC.10
MQKSLCQLKQVAEQRSQMWGTSCCSRSLPGIPAGCLFASPRPGHDGPRASGAALQGRAADLPNGAAAAPNGATCCTPGSVDAGLPLRRVTRQLACRTSARLPAGEIDVGLSRRALLPLPPFKVDFREAASPVRSSTAVRLL